jgi:hypothetical protein
MTMAVEVLGSGKSVSADFTPAAAAYGAGDVISTAKSFAFGAAPAARAFMITTVHLLVAHTAVISGETSYRLHLYNVTPPSAHADNDAWDLPSGDRSAYLGYVDLGTPVDVGSTLYVETSGVNKQFILPASGTIYGELVTNGAFTATAAARTVTLHGVPL